MPLEAAIIFWYIVALAVGIWISYLTIYFAVKHALWQHYERVETLKNPKIYREPDHY